jgi:hypothetical protein
MGDDKIESVTIRSYPKAVFLYPTFVTAVVCAILSRALMGHEAAGVYPKLPGSIFFTVFAINIMIVAWDFSRAGFVTVLLLAVIGVLATVVVEMKWNFLGAVHDFLASVELRAHPHVYLAMAAIYGFMLALAFASSRLDYWQVKPNEILHVTGFVGNIERFPAPNLRFRKEIPDVFEYVLLRSGTLVLEPAQGERHPLPNVLNVNAVEKRIEALLTTIDVTIEQPPKASDLPAP